MTELSPRERILLALAYRLDSHITHTWYAGDLDDLITDYLAQPPVLDIRLGSEGAGNWTRVEGIQLTPHERGVVRTLWETFIAPDAPQDFRRTPERTMLDTAMTELNGETK